MRNELLFRYHFNGDYISATLRDSKNAHLQDFKKLNENNIKELINSLERVRFYFKLEIRRGPKNWSKIEKLVISAVTSGVKITNKLSNFIPLI